MPAVRPFLCLALLLCLASAAWASPARYVVTSFGQAKRVLSGIYADHRETLYSGCSFEPDRAVLWQPCGYRRQQDSRRADHIEWEHVVPAELFGGRLPEWVSGAPECMDSSGRSYRGRHCASRANSLFRRIEADMYNLVPEIGEVNNLRGRLPMGEVHVSRYDFGRIGVRLGEGSFEPRDAVKGDVARIYLYMQRAYPTAVPLDTESLALFRRWSALDPVDPWECLRARRIAAYHERENGILTPLCAAAGL